MAQPLPLPEEPTQDRPASTALVNTLLDRVRELDPSLAADLSAAVKNITADREFGLVFNRHMPETVELPGRPVRKGDKVRIVGDKTETAWKVLRTHRRDKPQTAEIIRLAGGDEVRNLPLSDLVVVADFRDDIYPGLKPTGKIERGGDKPSHIVINGENYHALDALTFAYTEKVDCIYIDPPYNTGGDLTYNDKRVSKEDGDKHAKWLSFMERRLKLAKKLLKPTGVIIVAIDDNEQAHLKLLMDQVFDERNFISNVVWNGGRKNNARYVSNGADYMLIYAKSENTIAADRVQWREKKPGVDEALAAASQIWERANGDYLIAKKQWRSWLKKFQGQGISTDGVNRFADLDDKGRPLRTDGDLRCPNPRPNLQYDLLHPATGRPVRMHPNGWCWTQEKMAENIAAGRVRFGPDHTTPARGVRWLESMDTQVAESVFVRDRNPSGVHLEKVLGDRRFDFPKDVEVLKRWIGLVTTGNPDAVILDFFAGSGSTGQAVMELNAADNGRRQCILVTNNELNEKTEKELLKKGVRRGESAWEEMGIHQRVTRPRLETVVTGIRPDSSQYSDGLSENVEFFTLTYENPDAVRLNMAFSAIAPLLWLRAGGQGSRIDTPTDDFAVADRYAVLFNPDRVKPFLTAVRKVEDLRCVFIVTDDDNLFQRVSARIPAGAHGGRVDVVRLYENYLTNFKNNAGLGL